MGIHWAHCTVAPQATVWRGGILYILYIYIGKHGIPGMCVVCIAQMYTVCTYSTLRESITLYIPCTVCTVRYSTYQLGHKWLLIVTGKSLVAPAQIGEVEFLFAVFLFDVRNCSCFIFTGYDVCVSSSDATHLSWCLNNAIITQRLYHERCPRQE